MDKKITIITPTYNRKHTLNRCYESLCQQTDQRFEWLVIDDGSTDETEELIKRYKLENRIHIEYVKKENGGKASALNLALDIVNTKYCACLDSDEYFSKNAIEIAFKNLEMIKNADDICGILALRRDCKGGVLGGKEIPIGVENIKFIEINDKYDIKSEVICFYKTELIKKFRFPIFEKEKFVSPAYIQYEITRKYKFKVFRDPIIFCEYLEDGLTRNKYKVIRKNPNGYLAVKKQSFELATKFKKIIKHGIMYGAVSIMARNKKFIKESPHKILSILLLPFSYVVYLIRFKEGKEK